MMKTMKLALLDLGSAIPNNLQYMSFLYNSNYLKKKEKYSNEFYEILLNHSLFIMPNWRHR